MIEFTPWSALAGGSLIGIATAILLLSQQRIAGVSGIAAGLLEPTERKQGWRWMFVAGLVLGTVLFQLLGGDTSQIRIDADSTVLVIGGVLVGFGTRLGGGCTSGHGVCGISRGSARSIVATIIFMVTAAIVVYLSRHVAGA
ncbi:YeeE/YedE family protein [Elongatibacter sediminis]|uniref:YeeE/YedE family protein n=1 Tax=Elongatibacter sediminis TaxID=3119006 RepID=A0AAW9RN94_9GAMM